MSLLNKSINIFCILSKTGADRHRFLDDIIKDKKFTKRCHLKKLIYTTTRAQKEDKLIYDDELNYITIKDFKALDSSQLIEYRSYYTIDQGTVYYCTKKEDFEVDNNLICIASPYQFEYYRNYCNNQNIIEKYEKYRLYAIIIDATLHSRLKNITNRDSYNNEDAIGELALYDLCRRIISEKQEFDDVFKRIPELNHPMISKNVCYIDNNIYNDNDYYKSNLDDMKKFIKYHCKY